MRKLDWDEIERPPPEEVQDLPKHPVRLIVHNVRSIHNVGSIFRTSDAARVEHIHLTGYTGTPEHEDLHKTALGAQDAVSWSKHEEVRPLLAELQDRGYSIALLEQTDASIRTDEVSPSRFPLCLVLGNEVHGVEDAVVDAADLALAIPQYGTKISMNVSVAYGIAVYDLIRTARSAFGPPGTDEHTEK